ncbi:hypothetical protein A2926_01100 [Candidatus Giovannonibacteria bacterium RIFCSPLOWO2_01_FULL_44_40]|uniref:Uncharacterized protein n=1 Tax=Candidatus Giovannonibacteria bacterium RIFCSPHIGHO2_01_FULL_45_23 TaxID=1798325 RepID=A0A1F5VGK3_9BACT|nr:MAG: hypothetical protein A2834_02590 [Candidatus Giovannonibacteria bacterium RIFCSPHIGHO2_01_FULL_45_23]OGF75181.1 MAG: hypothetical protein A3C77_03810 [Candidatus Giovannonibacteria bacterium RIFCSPHIGHO2_02_FULL_45_13]OGF80034.1 MAG: hypothetical protein A2926_01100 [Candidatus Giovannonibacteria bacterium RIFCSPLOWO2_01_FULL_44_40]
MKKFLTVKWILVALVGITLYFNMGHIFANTWNTVCQNGGVPQTTFQTIVTVHGELTNFCKPYYVATHRGPGKIDDVIFFSHVVLWPITSVVTPALFWATELIFLGSFAKMMGLA